MKILITGVCGFAGSTIVKTWKEWGSAHELYGLDNFIRLGSEMNRHEFNCARDKHLCLIRRH